MISINGKEYNGEIVSVENMNMELRVEDDFDLSVGDDAEVDDGHFTYSDRAIKEINGEQVLLKAKSEYDDLLQNLRALGVKA